MKMKLVLTRAAYLFPLVLLTVVLAGCADDSGLRPASGPGAENPAATSGGNVVPAVGGAGNGGGVSGGGAGAGSGGQGSR